MLPLRVALVAARNDAFIARDTLDRLAASSPPLPDPWPDEARELFVDLLLENYRLVHLSGILEVVDELIDRRLGVVRARVTSAATLEEDQQRRLASALEEKLGQTVDLRVAVDEDLLGGFVALVGSERYDASVRGQLERLGAALAEGDEG